MKNDHPVFGDSDANTWIEFDHIDGCASSELISLIRSDREKIIGRAVDVLMQFLDKGQNEFRHKPELFDFLVRFLNDEANGFQVYLQFQFTAHLWENRPESDSWWAIVACPQPFLLRHYNVWHLGWYCQ